MIQSDKQVLITGCYRSGTEYITLLLNNHPQFSASMYTVSFMRFCYDRYNPVAEKDNYTRLVFDAAQRIRSRWQRQLSVHHILDYCEQTDEVTYGLLYDLMMSDLFLTDNVRGWAEKTQLVWTQIPAFLDLFPQGKVIHIIRDPRSVLASFKKYTYTPEPAYLSAVFNCFDTMQSGLAYNERFSDDQYRLVKYEDILTDPEAILKDLFSFLELSSTHDLLSEEGWTDAAGKPWHHNSMFVSDKDSGPKVSFDKQGAMDRWKQNLTPEDVALCESVTGELMTVYGYGRSDIRVDWQAMLKPLCTDDTLTAYFRRWLLENKGVEAFPTDPLKSENWEENRGD